MRAPESLERLKSLLAKLPGVGKRSAERMAIAIARNRDQYLPNLVEAIRRVGDEVTSCSLCGAMTPVNENPCPLCVDTRREPGVICVVEDPADIETLERTGLYRGRYHAVMGKLAPVRGESPSSLRMTLLIQRIRREAISEVILALNSDVEGDATAHFIAEHLAGQPVRITRLARGIPAGSGLSYADPITLDAALKNRSAW